MAYKYITTEYQSFMLQFIRTCFHLDIYVYKLRKFNYLLSLFCSCIFFLTSSLRTQ